MVDSHCLTAPRQPLHVHALPLAGSRGGYLLHVPLHVLPRELCPSLQDGAPGSLPPAGSKGGYIPPSLRNRAPGDVGESMTKRREENSVRVTNLSEDTREEDLRVGGHGAGLPSNSRGTLSAAAAVIQARQQQGSMSCSASERLWSSCPGLACKTPPPPPPSCIIPCGHGPPPNRGHLHKHLVLLQSAVLWASCAASAVHRLR